MSFTHFGDATIWCYRPDGGEERVKVARKILGDRVVERVLEMPFFPDSDYILTNVDHETGEVTMTLVRKVLERK